VTASAGTSRLLLRGCEAVVTMDDDRSELTGGSILIEDGAISWVGAGDPPGEPAAGAEVVDAGGCVAVPGFVNTHHHLFQAMTRVRAQDSGLFDWLRELYPIWAGLDAGWVHAAAAVGLAELALSGCTTTTDHHYVFPNDSSGLLEAEIEAAREIGVRFHPCRGSMDLGESKGGLPPDDLVEDTDAVLAATEQAVRRHHDPAPGSMLRIAVGPCSPFSLTPRLMRESAELARRLGVRLHTHISETRDEVDYCTKEFGRRPVELLEDLGFLGPDAWLAHAVHVDDGEIGLLARTGSGVASCPSSNGRLGSGTARVPALREAGVAVGLGVDGSASNDSGHMLAEARQALLAARAAAGPEALTARDALWLATRGGAACLGRDDVGRLSPDFRGDVALFDVTGLEFAGADADLVAALLFCAPRRARDVFVEGRAVVRDGHLVRVDEDAVAREGHRVGARLARREPAGATKGD
jgi:8-oxoguanine deaminase